MSLNQAVDALREVPMFRNIDPKQLRLFAFMGETIKYRPGERVFEKGDEGDALYLVIDGAVEVLIPTERGEERIAEIGRREVFGEIAVLCDRPRTTAIAAKTDLLVLRLERSVILNFLNEFPNVSIEIIKSIADRLEATNNLLVATRAELARADRAPG